MLATNTSAIPVTQIAAVTERPESVVGTHFFSPVPMMKLCELVRGYKTSDETLATARAFAEEIGKTCVVVNRDIAGFVTTRLISALVVEAVKLVESGVVSAEDLDTACRLGFGHAMGPLATTDLTGVDVLLHAGEEHLHRHRGREVLPAGAARSAWSPPATWAARPARASTRTEPTGRAPTRRRGHGGGARRRSGHLARRRCPLRGARTDVSRRAWWSSGT